MLRSLATLVLATALAIIMSWFGSALARADVPSPTDGDSGGLKGGLGLTWDVTAEGGSSATDGAPTGDGKCYDTTFSPATEVPCSGNDGWWNAGHNMYCKAADLGRDSPRSADRLNPDGTARGSYYFCSVNVPGHAEAGFFWEDYPPPDPAWEALVRDSLTLHAPKVGVGASIYRKYEEYGLTWWIGAPMWLWIDTKDDPMQWGTHTITATLGGWTTTATFTAVSVSYDTGDGTAPVVCRNAGAARPFNQLEAINHDSPYGCEHTYVVRSAQGDPTSRFTVTATVSWDVVWSTPVTHGHFVWPVESVDPVSVFIGEINVVTVPPRVVPS